MLEAKIEETVCEDRISELPEDLLVMILSFVPTKDAVATMFLSKRWLSLWTMVVTLEYKDGEDANEKEESKKSVWWFLDKSLKLHKAPVIYSLCMELGPGCPADADVGKWVAKAVDCGVRSLTFKLLWSANPTSLPKSLYTSKTLMELTLSHKILVDFPSSSSCLPSLRRLMLYNVVYKEEDSLPRFLSSCPVLMLLFLMRRKDDNVKKFIVKVPSLRVLVYGCDHIDAGNNGTCVVIDTPKLKHLTIIDLPGDYCSVHNMPCLEDASFSFGSYPDDKLLRCFSSVSSLVLVLNDDETLVCCSAITFSRLVKLSICAQESDWLEPLMLLLGNAPKLKYLTVNYEHRYQPDEGIPLSWNQPSSVPGCLSSQLEIFEWREYGDRVEEEEDEFLTYILANSKCLKTAAFSMRPTIDLEEQKLIINKLKDIPRVSTASHLLFK